MQENTESHPWSTDPSLATKQINELAPMRLHMECEVQGHHVIQTVHVVHAAGRAGSGNDEREHRSPRVPQDGHSEDGLDMQDSYAHMCKFISELAAAIRTGPFCHIPPSRMFPSKRDYVPARPTGSLEHVELTFQLLRAPITSALLSCTFRPRVAALQVSPADAPAVAEMTQLIIRHLRPAAYDLDSSGDRSQPIDPGGDDLQTKSRWRDCLSCVQAWYVRDSRESV